MKKLHGIALSFTAVANTLVTIFLFSHYPERLAINLTTWITLMSFAGVLLLLEMTGGYLSKVEGTIKAPAVALIAAAFIACSTFVPAAWTTGRASGGMFILYAVVLVVVTVYYLAVEKKPKHKPTIIWERDK